MQRTISKAEEGFCPEAVISIGNITVGITGNISDSAGVFPVFLLIVFLDIGQGL